MRVFTVGLVGSPHAHVGGWKELPSSHIDWVATSDGSVRIQGHGLYFYDTPVLGGGTIGDAYGAGVECFDLYTGEHYWREALPDVLHWQVKLGAWYPGTESEFAKKHREPGEVWSRWYVCCPKCGAVCTFPGVRRQAVNCGRCRSRMVPLP